MKRRPRFHALALLALLVPAAGSAQERYAVGGADVAIFNLAGEVEVVPTSADQVSVEVARGGRDGGELGVEVGEIEGRQTLRVVYPADRVVYDAGRWNGSARVRVRRDGTWGGDHSWFGGGDRVEVSSRGRGLDAHANLRVGVPRGQQIAIYQAVGRIVAENVDGRVRLDTHAGGIEARSMTGDLTLDTGSGGVVVNGMRGDLDVDTGSGGVRVAGVAGDRLRIDTGSGGVEADDVRAEEIEIDTGSGSVRLRQAAGRNIVLDTGSGSVEAELLADVDRLEIDTGSGGVTLRVPDDIGARLELDSGSGGVDVELPVSVTRQSRNELEGEIGDGRGTIVVDTGSGGIRIRRL